MAVPDTFGLYVILTDPVTGYEACAQASVDQGVAFLQLRMKDAPRDTVMAQAEHIRAITEGTATRFIINDFPEIAATVGADGVHIGQHDYAYSRARQIVGPDAIIGISTHSPLQTEAACALRPDYIGVGPVYATPTKDIPDPVIGPGGMSEMVRIATVPAVCLGGISIERLPEVLRHGARNFSMVRPVCQAQNPAAAIRDIQRIWRDNVV
jgi:thiamine-phosphate pyrophosphorylase